VLGQDIDAINSEVIRMLGAPYPSHVNAIDHDNLRTSRLPLPVVEPALERFIPLAVCFFLG
jgi:hypothetical protein